jgi:hypothetical protein
VLQVTLQEFGESILLDNALLAQSVAAGESASLAELLELAASVRSLYNTATLATRGFDFVQPCFALWEETATIFEQLCAAWTDVAEDSEAVIFYRVQLERFCELSRDRLELYSEGQDRRRLLARKAAEL